VEPQAHQHAGRRKRPLRIGPPLRGEKLAVLGCCGAVRGQRRALIEVDRRLSLAQRYAIDVVRVDDRLHQLQTFAGDPTSNESYLIFGGRGDRGCAGR
jgi:hypothetical protein